MIKAMERLSTNVPVIVMYTQSPVLDVYIRRTMRHALGVHKDFVLVADSMKEANSAKALTISPPLLGDRWLLHVNVDNLSRREIGLLLTRNTSSAVTVFWTTKYRNYMQIIGYREFKALGVHGRHYSYNRLSPQDIIYLYHQMNTGMSYLPDDVLKFVAKSYMYNVSSVMSLFQMLNSGEKFETRQKVIERIGIGGNTTDTLVVDLLSKTHFKTLKSRKLFYRKCLKRLTDLKVKYEYRTLRNFMLSTIDGFIVMKRLQLEGIYGRAGVPLPEWVDPDQVQRIRRFDSKLSEDISLAAVLNLKKFLVTFDSFDSETALITAIGVYIDTIPYDIEIEARGEQVPVKKFKRRARGSF